MKTIKVSSHCIVCNQRSMVDLVLERENLVQCNHCGCTISRIDLRKIEEVRP